MLSPAPSFLLLFPKNPVETSDQVSVSGSSQTNRAVGRVNWEMPPEMVARPINPLRFVTLSNPPPPPLPPQGPSLVSLSSSQGVFESETRRPEGEENTGSKSKQSGATSAWHRTGVEIIARQRANAAKAIWRQLPTIRPPTREQDVAVWRVRPTAAGSGRLSDG